MFVRKVSDNNRENVLVQIYILCGWVEEGERDNLIFYGASVKNEYCDLETHDLVLCLLIVMWFFSNEILGELCCVHALNAS